METLCGIRLHSVGVAIGWIGAVFSFICLVVLSICLSSIDTIAKSIYDSLNDKDISEEALRVGLVWVFGIYLALNIINLIASALLVAGTIKERHLLLVPWLLNAGLSVICSGLYIVVFLAVTISNGVPFGQIIVPLISSAISLAIQYTIWSAIYSLFKNIRATREQQQQLINTATTTSYPSYTKM